MSFMSTSFSDLPLSLAFDFSGAAASAVALGAADALARGAALADAALAVGSCFPSQAVAKHRRPIATASFIMGCSSEQSSNLLTFVPGWPTREHLCDRHGWSSARNPTRGIPAQADISAEDSLRVRPVGRTRMVALCYAGSSAGDPSRHPLLDPDRLSHSRARRDRA